MAITASRRQEIPMYSIKYSEKANFFNEISQDQLGIIRQPTNLHIRVVFAADRLIKNKGKENKRNESSHSLVHMDKFINPLKSALEKGNVIMFISAGMSVHSQNSALLVWSIQ